MQSSELNKEAFGRSTVKVAAVAGGVMARVSRLPRRSHLTGEWKNQSRGKACVS